MAAVGLLAAERHRRLTGAGQYVKLALLDVALATMGHMGFIAEAQVNGDERGRHGNELFGAFGRDFETRDGRRVMVVALTRRQWQNLCKATGLGPQFDAVGARLGLDLTEEGNRFRARAELAAVLAPWIAARDAVDLLAAFAAADVCAGPYQSVREMLDSDADATRDNPLFSLQSQPDIGRYLMPGSPLYFGSHAHADAVPAPRLGAHTDEILATVLGLDAAAIGKLHDAKLVAGARP
jgi:2-methylfumaryl-CoA isomerase